MEHTRDYLNSFVTHSRLGPFHGLVELVAAAGIAGYMINGFPSTFLERFRHPLYQFPILLILFDTYELKSYKKWWIFADAAIALVIFHLLKFLLGFLYNDPPDPTPNLEFRDFVVVTLIYVLALGSLANSKQRK